MVAVHRKLSALSVVVCCFMPGFAAPASAASPASWYLLAIGRILHPAGFDAKDDRPVKDTAQVYSSKILKEDGAITLKGHVPSENDVKVLQGVAAATAPGATFADRTKVNAAVPDRDTWLAGMTFALRQLAKLDTGSAILRDNVLAIEGVTKPDDNFALVRQKLSEEAPRGLVIEQIGVRPPEARPFIWLAQLQPGNISLSGHVPNEFDQTLVIYAQTLFQNSQVSNGMASAVGAPGDWLTAAKLSLDILALFQKGSVSLHDRVISLDGTLASPEMAELLKTYSHKLPKGFRLETNISQPPLSGSAIRAEELNFAARGLPASLNP